MIGRLKQLLSGGAAAAPKEDRLRLAAAALLVEAATLDGAWAEAERGHILRLLAERFALSAAEAQELLADATQAVARSTQLHGFTKTITDHFDARERIEMIEMLWEVAYADGTLHDYEANLVRRVAGLIYVPDQDSGSARKRAMARMGIGDGLA